MIPLSYDDGPEVDRDLGRLGLQPRARASLVLSRIIIGALVLFVVLLVFVPWQQSVDGAGRVIAYAPQERQQFIEAPIEGRVVSWNVQEGMKVKKGDVLCEMTDNDPLVLSRIQTEIDSLKQRIAAARARAESIESRIQELEAARKSALDAAGARVSMAKNRISQAQQAVEAADTALKTSELNYERQKALFGEGLSSKRQAELAELDLVKTRTEAERARAALLAARSEEAALSSDQLKVMADVGATINDAHAGRASALSDEATASAELARTEGRLARQQTQRVTAPRDGVVLSVIARQGGELLKAGQPLLSFVPDTDVRAVELWMSGNDIPLITEGRHVRMQFEGWPAIQFTGWPSVAVGTFGGRVAWVDAADNGQGKFRIVVVPDDGEPWPSGVYLRQGTRVNGWVLLNRVRLGYELWRQMNGFPPAVANTAPEKKSGK
ncbi:MAG: HlyD family efflux transporter periplasmic adaptor subunit [Labilithrix sp.]|nr:HlyD family efflux transporter periplasmic adaptor subunit [Labilithrix sp.]MCW5810881.1 HlyD family efflux transporter periplasmic adaptor subunit [Labilithrix sp.]